MKVHWNRPINIATDCKLSFRNSHFGKQSGNTYQGSLKKKTKPIPHSMSKVGKTKLPPPCSPLTAAIELAGMRGAVTGGFWGVISNRWVKEEDQNSKYHGASDEFINHDPQAGCKCCPKLEATSVQRLMLQEQFSSSSSRSGKGSPSSEKVRKIKCWLCLFSIFLCPSPSAIKAAVVTTASAANRT